MSEFRKLVEVTIDPRDINFNPQELVTIIMSREDCEYDIEFINAYFKAKNWTSSEELEHIALGLTPEAWNIIKDFVKIREKTDV